jgi:putative Mg2+ transporter-C (MgtC) family protein
MNLSSLDPLEWQILVKVAIAMLLGALIGFEREVADKPAGLRTHMLVTGGATLLITLGYMTEEYFIGIVGTEIIRSDPIRVIAAVITGVTFLGAGTIIRQRDEKSVEGLTTAASILFASGVGMSVAVSKWVLAIGSTALLLITLRLIPLLLSKKNWRSHLEN